jgi:hypothetical protein
MTDDRRAVLLQEFELRPPARDSEVTEAARALGTEFPVSYREFLGTANGGEGQLGRDSYLILWPVNELVLRNEEYKPDRDYGPDLVFIGTDGGNEVFAFRRSDGNFVSAPLIGMAEDEIRARGTDFQDLLESFA